MVNGWINGGCRLSNPKEWKKIQDEAKLISAIPEMLALIKKIDAHLVKPELLDDLIGEADEFIARIEGIVSSPKWLDDLEEKDSP